MSALMVKGLVGVGLKKGFLCGVFGSGVLGRVLKRGVWR